MGCDESFITMKLIWHGYLVLSLGICAHKTPIENGLRKQHMVPFCLCHRHDLQMSEQVNKTNSSASSL